MSVELSPVFLAKKNAILAFYEVFLINNACANDFILQIAKEIEHNDSTQVRSNFFVYKVYKYIQ